MTTSKIEPTALESYFQAVTIAKLCLDIPQLLQSQYINSWIWLFI